MTPFNVYGVTEYPAQKLVAILYLPTGLTAPAGLTITGGTVGGPQSIPTGATRVYLGLDEDPDASGEYGATGSIAGTDALPDSDPSDEPYTAKVVVVDPATNMADYAAVAAAADAPGNVIARPRQIMATMGDGHLTDGAWGGGGGGGSSGVGTGTGDVAVTHDGGTGVTVDGAASGEDVMRVVRTGTGAPIADAEIAAYLSADYDAGNTGLDFRRGTTRTGEDGRWRAPLMLAGGGNAYTIVVNATGYAAVVAEIAIA
jgi:hypothetical protein